MDKIKELYNKSKPVSLVVSVFAAVMLLGAAGVGYTIAQVIIAGVVLYHPFMELKNYEQDGDDTAE